MPWPAHLRSLARNLLRRARTERQLDEEARAFLDLVTDENVQRGMDPAAARRLARLESGGVDQLKERVRGARAGAWLETLGQDLRYGLRMLRKNPGFAAVAVLTLALGIGANTAIFSVVDAVLLRPLPYPQAERLVTVWSTTASQEMPLTLAAPPDFRAWRENAKKCADMGAFAYADFNLAAAGGEPEHLLGARVSASLLPTLGVRAALGRVFLPQEEQFGRHREVVLSHELWRRRFGASRKVLGRSVHLNGETYTVVGVMPAGMPFFDNANPVALWVPLAFEPGDNFNTRNNRFLNVVARLAPGVRLAAAQAELTLVARRIERTDPLAVGYGALLVPLQQQLVGRVRPVLLVLLGAVGLVLLIACANVASLLLARAAARQRELALRASLGAGRGRLFRQLLAESLPLGLLGGAAGTVLALAAERLLLASLLPASFPRFNAIGLDGGVLAFTLGVSLATALLFGLAPAVHALRPGLREGLGEGGRSASAGVRHTRLRGLLVVGETALALVLLIGAALLLESFAALRKADPGFSPRGALAVLIPLPPARYPLPTLANPSPDRAMAFFDRLVTRVSAMPGVRAAGIGSQLPFGVGVGWGKNFYLEDRPLPARLDQVPETLFKLASPGFFPAVGYRLRSGRFFGPEDTPSSQPVALVNETFARRQFGAASPLGKVIVLEPPAHLLPPPPPGAVRTPRRTIVGVLADVKNSRFNAPIQPEVYAPVAQNVGEGWPEAMALVLRTSTEPTALIGPVRAAVRALDPELPVDRLAAMDEHFQRSLSQPRFGMLLLGLFAGIALLLAAIGVYGLVAYEARQRTHEIGIRSALGARPSRILRLVIGDGLKLALLGAALGIAAAAGLVRLLASLLWGVGQHDPLAFLAAPVLLIAAALLAACLPALRAMRLDPLAALRHD
jgi:predicted permease